MKNTLIKGILIASIFNIVSCSKAKKNTDVVIKSEINMEHQMLNFQTTKSDNAPHNGKYISSVDSISQFGAGYSFVFPDSLKDRNLMVYVKAWVRENEAPIEGSIVVALSNSKGVGFWGGFKTKTTNYTPNTWVEINDSVIIASSLLKDNFVELSVFGHKTMGKDRFDLDDLNITYRFFK